MSFYCFPPLFFRNLQHCLSFKNTGHRTYFWGGIKHRNKATGIFKLPVLDKQLEDSGHNPTYSHSHWNEEHGTVSKFFC